MILNDGLCNGRDQDQTVFICQGNKYCLLNIYCNYVESKIERILWIGFYKNKQNKKCFIDKLPKDIIMHILKLLGKLVYPYIKIDI